MISINTDESRKLSEFLTKLAKVSRSKVIFLIDKSGQLLSKSGSPSATNDLTFASLTAGNIAASEALSKLIDNKGLSHTFTETPSEGIYMILLLEKYILVSIFDKKATNLGIVRLKIRKIAPLISEFLRQIEQRNKKETNITKNVDIENLDIDSLFEE